jgi:hypothetical protein
MSSQPTQTTKRREIVGEIRIRLNDIVELYEGDIIVNPQNNAGELIIEVIPAVLPTPRASKISGVKTLRRQEIFPLIRGIKEQSYRAQFCTEVDGTKVVYLSDGHYEETFHAAAHDPDYPKYDAQLKEAGL